MTSYSQSSQDLFVQYCTQHKRNGTFLEIGACHPTHFNNTYVLETQYNWRGVMIEIDPKYEIMYKRDRSPNTSYYIGDARSAPYAQLLADQNMPSHIDYLQVDVDVDTKSTVETIIHLDNTVFDKYTFGCVTFEHDIYLGDFFDTQKTARDIFAKRGYILAFPNVRLDWLGRSCAYEDWYVHPSIISESYIKKIRQTSSLDHLQIRRILEQASVE